MSFLSAAECAASTGLLKEFALPPSTFASKDVHPLTRFTELMNKRPSAKKPQAKTQTVKKQIPVKKIAPDRIEELVKKHLGKIGEAENAFKSASALLEKHKTKYPELEQYIGVLGTSERKVRLSHHQRLLRRCTSYSWSTIGLRNGRSSPRATVSGIANEYRPNMLMWSWISGESLATSAS